MKILLFFLLLTNAAWAEGLLEVVPVSQLSGTAPYLTSGFSLQSTAALTATNALQLGGIPASSYFLTTGTVAGPQVSGTVSAALVSSTAAASGTLGFLIQTGTNYSLLTVSGTGSSAALLLGGVTVGVSWPLLSPSGNVQIGGENGGTYTSINDNGGARFANAGGGTISISPENLGDASQVFGDNYDIFSINGDGSGIFAAGDFTFDNVGGVSFCEGAAGFDDAGEPILTDDSTTPTNPATPAGYIHSTIGGSDAWIPYYR